MHASTNIVLRLGLGLLGLAFLRDGHAALRGRELWLQSSGFRSIFLRAGGRFGGVFLIVAGFVILGIAWFW